MRPISHHSSQEALGSAALFHGCTQRELRRIERLATTVEVLPGRVLCAEGAIGSEFFVIVRGSAHVERAGRHVACLGPGQAFGEVALVSRNGRNRRTATVVAAEPMTVFVFNRAEFNSLLETVPALARRLLENVSNVALSLAADTAPQGEPREHASNGSVSAPAG